MEQENLIRMWRIINFHDIVKSGNSDDAAQLVEESDYHPIDAKHCVVVTDGLAFLLVQENGVIVNSIEAGDLSVALKMMNFTRGEK